ncbi:MAG: tyrosine-type recombinase/integrase [Candidatus Diapherotrites archaeon]|nr:tyrosine-type recombinase/integrase [Candidatus Diapherotrites archaeon]
MRTEKSFHDYPRMLKRLCERIWPEEYPGELREGQKSFQLNPRNKQILKDLLSHLERENYSSARIIRLVSFVALLGEMLGKDFDKATKEDIQGTDGIVSKILKKWSNDTTREMGIQSTKQFYKWLLGENEEYPDIVRKIKFRRKYKEEYLKEILTKEEVAKVIDTADHPMKKALIGTLYSAGPRISELGLLSVKDVEFQDDEAVISITESKTRRRRVIIVNSTVKLLHDWFAIHPNRNKPDFRETPLFVSVSHQKYGRRMEYASICKMLKVTTALAGIQKPCNPHHWRHSFATHLAQDGYSEYQIKIILGHSMTSKSTARYIHMAGQGVFDVVRKKNGKKIMDEGAQKPALEYKKCDTCGYGENTFNQLVCNKCMRPLGIAERLQYKDQLSEIRGKMENMEKAYHLLLKAHLETIESEKSKQAL